MFRAFLFACLLVGCAAVSARAADPPGQLDKAKRTYDDTIDKARLTLLDAFASATKAAMSSGSLDVVRALEKEREAFEFGGTVPTSPRLKAAGASYQTTTKAALAALDKAYEQEIRDLTKAGKLDAATALQKEQKEFRLNLTAVGLRPVDVTSKEALHRYIAGSAWTWGDMRFKPTGHVEVKDWDARGLVTRWEAVDRRTVLLIIEKGRDQDRYAVLTFNEELTEFRGYDFNGKDRIPASKRK